VPEGLLRNAVDRKLKTSEHYGAGLHYQLDSLLAIEKQGRDRRMELGRDEAERARGLWARAGIAESAGIYLASPLDESHQENV